MFSSYPVYLLFYLFPFSFEGMSFVLIVPVPGHFLKSIVSVKICRHHLETIGSNRLVVSLNDIARLTPEMNVASFKSESGYLCSERNMTW